MASVRSCLAAVFVLGLFVVPRPPARAARIPTVRLYGRQYENLQTFARWFGLTFRWTEPARRARLESRWTRIDFEQDSREITLNHLRVFLGDPVVTYHDDIYVSRLDAEKLLTPILAPNLGASVPRLKVIAIDPGHGGNDHGTANRRLHLEEKTLTLDVARRVRKLLEAEDYRVVMTRKSDRYVALDRRAELANRAGADLFVSIHFNAAAGAGGARVRGVETYTMTPRHQISTQPERDKDMIAVAYPGNRSDFWNAVLGYQMQRELVGRLKTGDRGLKHRRLAVLRAIKCPGVLVEPGYLSNLAEGERLRTARFRQQVAEAVVAGIRAYARVLHRVRSG